MYPVTYNNSFKIENLVRPANTTAYASGQVINDNTPRLIVFPGTQSRRGGYLTRVSLVTNNNAHTTALRLWLFASSSTPLVDQSTLNLSHAKGLDCEGYVDFTTFVVPGTSGFAFSEGQLISRPMQFTSGSDNNLYGILEARAAFTPTSGQQFGIELYSEFSA